MRMRSGVGVMEWLRSILLGDRDERLARLEREVDALRRAAVDPTTVRPVVVQVLRQELQRSPQEMAAILEPLLQEMLSPRTAASPEPHRRSPRWLPAAAAGMLLMVGGGFGETRWSPPAPAVSSASASHPVEVAASAPAAAPVSKPQAVILQESNGGFGLGHAQLSDAQLAREVRTRLASCKKLAGAAVSFSVKDGWVWLRGETTASGRDAAERALGDLGGGAFVVNQLVVGKPAADMLAER